MKTEKLILLAMLVAGAAGLLLYLSRRQSGEGGPYLSQTLSATNAKGGGGGGMIPSLGGLF